MTPVMEKQSKASVIALPGWQVLQIVQPLIEMGIAVLDLDATTQRKDFLSSSKRFQDAMKLLAKLLSDHLQRPVYANQLRNVSVRTALVTGIFDVYFTEAKPSQEGNVSHMHHLRLASVSRENTIAKFASFIRANDPQGTSFHARAEEMIGTLGL